MGAPKHSLHYLAAETVLVLCRVLIQVHERDGGAIVQRPVRWHVEKLDGGRVFYCPFSFALSRLDACCISLAIRERIVLVRLERAELIV
jgi:hypothetical protein